MTTLSSQGNIVTDLIGEWVWHRSGDDTVTGLVRVAFVGTQGFYLVLETEDGELRVMDFWGPTKIVRKCTRCGKWDATKTGEWVGVPIRWEHKDACP